MYMFSIRMFLVYICFEYMYICIYTYIYIYIYVCIYTCVDICVIIYMCNNTHTHAHQHGDGKLLDGGNVYDMTYLHGTVKRQQPASGYTYIFVYIHIHLYIYI